MPRAGNRQADGAGEGASHGHYAAPGEAHNVVRGAAIETRAADARGRASSAPAGKKREMLLRQARASEMAVQIDRWISSPRLRPPE
jgi:hypothetical protein